MAFHFDLGEDLLNMSGRIDQESGALDAQVLLSIHTFFYPNSVQLSSFVLGVGKQGERQAEFVFEAGLSLARVRRHADHDRIRHVQLGAGVPEGTGLFGTARSVSFRIEVQDDVLSL